MCSRYCLHAAPLASVLLAGRSWSATLYPHLYHGKTMKFLQGMAGGVGKKSSRELKAAMPQQLDAWEERRGRGLLAEAPSSLDWGNKDGVNYLAPPINQGGCGSCYAVASTDMLQTRLRIQAKEPYHPKSPALSVEDVLQCSEVNQGCGGGYPFLVQKYGAE